MKKLSAIVLVIILIVVIDQKLWRVDEVSSDNDDGYNPYIGGIADDYDDLYDVDDNSFTMSCYRCHGSGKCEDCGGSGKSNLTGVLSYSGCGLCAASGRCYKCNGKGYTVHY